jgi:hypothetical protein
VPGREALFAAIGLFAYGPAPGVELIPYFLGLLAWLGLAFAAIVWAPIASVIRRMRGTKNTAPAETAEPPRARDDTPLAG